MSRRLDGSVTARVAGHFGEWLQGRLGPDGPVCLLTLPCPPLFVEVERLDDGPLELLQSVELVTQDRARDFLSRVSGREGVFRLKATMPPGGGAGASTGALVGLARAAGGLCEKVVDACVAVEGASDPLMLPRPDGVLWASREGRAVRSVPTLPAAEILGGFWGPPVFTDPRDGRFADVADLAEKLSINMNLQALADVASALRLKRCALLRGPVEDPIGTACC